jgi:hypothetical protein
MTSRIEALVQQLDGDNDASYAAGNGRRWPFNTERDHLLQPSDSPPPPRNKPPLASRP